MPMRVFALYNALGGTLWVVTFCALGYVFGRNLPRLVHYIGRVSLLLAIFIAVIAGVVVPLALVREEPRDGRRVAR